MVFGAEPPAPNISRALRTEAGNRPVEHATSKPLVTFEKRSPGAPEAMKAWFYAGDNHGNEFVYPNTTAVELAKQSQENVPSMSNTLTSSSSSQDPNFQQVTEMEH